ncbi:UNVERIFIED_CONTAM: hypothetical protein HDU68_002776 [Siphonaria sp. JEL0065]|nr:hypothetical protein HDU68_002776 [Siphonaria sp. JEL0065]
MKFLATAALLASSALLALTAPAQGPVEHLWPNSPVDPVAAAENLVAAARRPKTFLSFNGCPNMDYFSLVFRSLSYDTLDALSAANRQATFFVEPKWIAKNADLIGDAASQGHNIGLAIVDPNSYIDLKAQKITQRFKGQTIYGYPVIESALDKFINSANTTWYKHLSSLNIAPTLAAFTTIPGDAQDDHHLLMAALQSYGIGQAMVSFGHDAVFDSRPDWNQDFIMLSNTLQYSYHDTSNVTVESFYKSRKDGKSLESVKTVTKTATFLETVGGATFGTMSKCIEGYWTAN